MMYQKNQLSQPLAGTEESVVMPDGARIYTIASGQGNTTVLLAHAYGFSHQAWSVVVAGLNQLNYRTIVFDQRGHGQSTTGTTGVNSRSMASDYENLIKHFDLKDCLLVGHSMGGFLAMKFLIEHPDIQHTPVRGCVLMATFAGDVNKHNFQNRLQVPLIKSGILLKLIRWKVIGDYFGRSLLGEKPDPEVVRWVPNILLQQDHTQLVPILEACVRESYYDRLSAITVPCVVMLGDQDVTTPAFHTDDIVRKLSNATRIDVKGKGHCLNVEAPQEVIKAIRLVDLDLSSTLV